MVLSPPGKKPEAEDETTLVGKVLLRKWRFYPRKQGDDEISVTLLDRVFRKKWEHLYEEEAKSTKYETIFELVDDSSESNQVGTKLKTASPMSIGL